MEFNVAALQQLNESLSVEFPKDFEAVKPYAALGAQEQKQFMLKVVKAVNDGLGSNKKDSLSSYLQVSVRAREKFLAVKRIVVELSPPGKLKSSSQVERK